MPTRSAKNPGGRPSKFREPCRPVTMTLPERILEKLADIDPDRAFAVVKATEAVLRMAQGTANPVELIEMAPGKALIVTGPSKALRSIPWLKTIEIAPARFLLTIPSGTPIEALEVSLRDVAATPNPGKTEQEVAVLNELLNLIGQNRRALRLSKAEVLIIDIA